MAKRTPIERFFEYVKITESCWIWTGGRYTSGGKYLYEKAYGRFKDNYECWLAHRWSYKTFVGPIPDGMKVLHHCDNPPCVRPDHLFLGTLSDNMRDMAEKFRFSPHKLIDEQVLSILADTRTQMEIAQDNHISQNMVSKIKLRQTWKKFPNPPERRQRRKVA